MPLFWSFGSANAVPAIITHGGCVVLQESFEAGEALALIEHERCSVYYGMGIGPSRSPRFRDDALGRHLSKTPALIIVGLV